MLETGGGGAGRHVLDLARELAARNHRVVVIYSPVRAEPGFVRELQSAGVETIPVDMHRAPGLHDVRAARVLGATIKRHGSFDIVHGHSSKAGALIRLTSVGGAKRVYTPHAFRGLDPEAGLSTRVLFNSVEIMLGAINTDALIAVSGEELAFAERMRIAPGRRHLIRNGVIRPFSIDRLAVKHSLGLSPDDVVVGFVGRLSHQKAPERFVAAAATVMRRRPELRAVMIGDGEGQGLVAERIAASGVADRFVCLGLRDAREYLGAFDLLMMTSRYEGLSYVMLESLAAGVPLISTDVAGVRDVIDQDVSGIVTGGNDVVSALADALDGLVADPNRRAAMAISAGRCGTLLNGTRMINETEALYRQLAGKAA